MLFLFLLFYRYIHFRQVVVSCSFWRCRHSFPFALIFLTTQRVVCFIFLIRPAVYSFFIFLNSPPLFPFLRLVFFFFVLSVFYTYFFGSSPVFSLSSFFFYHFTPFFFSFFSVVFSSVFLSFLIFFCFKLGIYLTQVRTNHLMQGVDWLRHQIERSTVTFQWYGCNLSEGKSAELTKLLVHKYKSLFATTLFK